MLPRKVFAQAAPSALLAATALLLASGCKKPPCPEGAYSNPTHKLCIVLPEGEVFDKEDDQPDRKSLQFKHKDRGSPRMSVIIPKDPAASFTSQKAFIEGLVKNAAGKGDTVAASGKPEGGDDGAFVLINYKNGVISQLNYALKSGNRVAECYTNTDTKSAPAILEACKTLRFLP